ncbi:hypothetical protein [Hymenobacter actinosclerus]|uniref:hypothetical protein n=1 Tax=Hymenobacter actinosclerus TaxID=82805 RepID=UPI001160C821|nr:hypothetical protein [Hymenobacter actinosclerus]
MDWQLVSKVSALSGAGTLFIWACLRFRKLLIFRAFIGFLTLLLIVVVIIASFGGDGSAEFGNGSWSEAQSRTLANYLLMISFALFTVSLLAFAVHLLVQ